MENKDRPAYPASEETHTIGTHGMSKREIIAAMAMQGLIANGWFGKDASDTSLFKDRAERAIKHADELLKQLDKP